MRDRSTRREACLAAGILLTLVLVSVWQTRQLRAVQLESEKALYVERLRTAQVVVENEMLAAAYLTAPEARTRERARTHLERSPW